MALPSPTRTDDVVHAPYIPSAEAPAELTPGVILLGIALGLMFAASSVYLALKVSLTVSASIPVAVLSITIFRYMARVLRRPPATILQNNMVQTTGSAGESIVVAGARPQLFGEIRAQISPELTGVCRDQWVRPAHYWR